MVTGRADMRGKTCIVTGANSGIGLETCVALKNMGAKVVMACRNEERGEKALRDIESRTSEGAAEVMALDLGSLVSVRAFAETFLDRHDRLDVLVNNAGAMPTTREETADGFEKQFGANHLGPFALTVLLLDRVKAGPAGRIVSVSSMMHSGGTIDFSDLMAETGYGTMKAYGQSKLANVLFTYELARRLEGTGATANCLHPGGVRTKIMRNVRGPLGIVIGLGMYLMIGPAKGARTSVYLASSPTVEGVTGKYFYKCRPAKSSAESHDAEVARRLWAVSAELTGVGA